MPSYQGRMIVNNGPETIARSRAQSGVIREYESFSDVVDLSEPARIFLVSKFNEQSHGANLSSRIQQICHL
jgi:hypothetical protein